VLVLTPQKYGKAPKVKVIREAKINPKATPLPDHKLRDLYRSTYYKHMSRLSEGK
jgi:hypothetical protein